MPFTFTPEQWVGVSSAIQDVGGRATDAVKAQLEADITGVFSSGSHDAQIIDALRRVSKSAHALSRDLRDLALARHSEELDRVEPRSDVIDNDVRSRLNFARQVRAYAEGADFDLDKGYRHVNDSRRGRPNDTKPAALARALLRLAKEEKWVVVDGRGRTSAELTELACELTNCARASGITHVRDRRAMTRALAQARAEERADAKRLQWLAPELDALVSREP